MIKFFKVNIEPKKRLRMIEVIFSIGLCIASIISIDMACLILMLILKIYSLNKVSR